MTGTPPFQPPIPVPDVNVNYFYEGALQDYAMHVPASYDGAARTPLVVYLHGYTGLPEEPFHNPTGLVRGDRREGLAARERPRPGRLVLPRRHPRRADVLEVSRTCPGATASTRTGST